jgi:flagellar operon protein
MSVPDRINHNPALIPPLGPAQPQKADQTKTADGKSFNEILRTKVSQQVGVQTTPVTDQQPATSDIKWSAHAAARMKQRGINLGEAQLARLESAVNKAAAKGSKESLVLMDDVAMVVSVKNRTVITALARDQAKENVFTNIDSAVIA